MPKHRTPPKHTTQHVSPKNIQLDLIGVIEKVVRTCQRHRCIGGTQIQYSVNPIQSDSGFGFCGLIPGLSSSSRTMRKIKNEYGSILTGSHFS